MLQTEELNISMSATDETRDGIDNARDIKQSVRKMRTGETADRRHTSNDNAYLALQDLIIEYKGTLIIIHQSVYPGIPEF